LAELETEIWYYFDIGILKGLLCAGVFHLTAGLKLWPRCQDWFSCRTR